MCLFLVSKTIYLKGHQPKGEPLTVPYGTNIYVPYMTTIYLSVYDPLYGFLYITYTGTYMKVALFL